MIAPNTVGIWIGGLFLIVATSSGVRAGSLAAKSAVPAANDATPAPEPTPW